MGLCFSSPISSRDLNDEDSMPCTCITYRGPCSWVAIFALVVGYMCLVNGVCLLVGYHILKHTIPFTGENTLLLTIGALGALPIGFICYGSSLHWLEVRLGAFHPLGMLWVLTLFVGYTTAECVLGVAIYESMGLPEGSDTLIKKDAAAAGALGGVILGVALIVIHSFMGMYRRRQLRCQ